MHNAYKTLKSELLSELHNITDYWTRNTIDNTNGGFLGKIDHNNTIIKEASKGIILNTRILWSFSAVSNQLNTTKHSAICSRAYHYLNDHFKDSKYKGVYWELTSKGVPINKRKQVYAQAFTIYALSEYYLFSKNEDAKAWAIEIFETLEHYANDGDGYLEAFNEDWSPIEDMRLSSKDMNAEKTMNTHLHVLEAYTTLLKIYDTQKLKDALTNLIELFITKFLSQRYQYHLFFDKQWNLQSNVVSYGHDIETAWLVLDAAKQLNNTRLINKSEDIALKVAEAFLAEAIDSDGGVFNEKNLSTNHVDTDKHWWPQVEALIGLQCVNTIKPHSKYIEASLKIWEFTKTHLIDHNNGEWFFRVNKNGVPYTCEDKVSMWKAPYHTTRACLMLNK